MTEVIHKFMLPWPTESHTSVRVVMPKVATILHVHAQGEIAYLWARVPIGAKMIERFFRIFMTGEYWTEHETQHFADKYIGTFHTTDGYVGHVYYD